MKVFLSWSGHKSHQVALVLRDWLPSVIQSITPYVSSEDIDKGARWSTDIAKELEDSTFGLLCVTKENLEAPWLLFEAGALSKMMDKSYVCPFIFDLKRAEVKGPILQFQSTIFEKEDVKKLVLTLNKACGASALKEDLLTKAFEVWWPSLFENLESIKQEENPESEENSNEKSFNSEMLEEILELSRTNQKLLRSPEALLPPEYFEFIYREKLDRTLTDEDKSIMMEQRHILMELKHRLIQLKNTVEVFRDAQRPIDDEFMASYSRLYDVMQHYIILAERSEQLLKRRRL